LLYTNGFSDVWLNPCSIDINNFPKVFKQRLTDQFIQTWRAALCDSNVLCTYRLFNSTFECQLYLDKLPAKNRTVLSKFRLSSHQLRIETGLYGNNRIPQNERYCLICNSRDLEDEFHFICVYNIYSDLRKNI